MVASPEAKKKRKELLTGQTAEAINFRNKGFETGKFVPSPTLSRPTGTPASQNVDITKLSPEKQMEVSEANAIVGQTLRKERVQSLADETLARARVAELDKQQGQQEESIRFQQPIKDIEPFVEPIKTPFQRAQEADLNARKEDTAIERVAGGLNAMAESVATSIGILENIRALTSIGGKDTARVKDSRQLISQTNGLLKAEIDNVKNGADPTQAFGLVQKAISANNVLYSDAHLS